jgi:hypothetical protein
MILVLGRRGFVLPMKLVMWLRIEYHAFGPWWLGSGSGKVIGLLAVLRSCMKITAETEILVILP